MILLKKNIILCIWCNAMCLHGSRFKKHYFPHTVQYCCSSMLHLSETYRFLQSSSFWEARCALIGQLYSALGLAGYLKHVTEMLRHNTMSAFVIVETPNKHYSTQLWIVSSKFFKYRNVLKGCESEEPNPLYSVHSHSYGSYCRPLSLSRIRK